MSRIWRANPEKKRWNAVLSLLTFVFLAPCEYKKKVDILEWFCLSPPMWVYKRRYFDVTSHFIFINLAQVFDVCLSNIMVQGKVVLFSVILLGLIVNMARAQSMTCSLSTTPCLLLMYYSRWEKWQDRQTSSLSKLSTNLHCLINFQSANLYLRILGILEKNIIRIMQYSCDLPIFRLLVTFSPIYTSLSTRILAKKLIPHVMLISDHKCAFSLQIKKRVEHNCT